MDLIKIAVVAAVAGVSGDAISEFAATRWTLKTWEKSAVNYGSAAVVGIVLAKMAGF